jgi:glyoxylase-like metal-dependent hydrolase (beta-lactamase superfamily II)
VFEALSNLQQPREAITHILTTHKHADHAGGNEELLATMPHVAVIGGRGDGVPAVTQEVGQDDSFSVRVHTLGLEFAAVIVGLRIPTIVPFHCLMPLMDFSC